MNMDELFWKPTSIKTAILTETDEEWCGSAWAESSVHSATEKMRMKANTALMAATIMASQTLAHLAMIYLHENKNRLFHVT